MSLIEPSNYNVMSGDIVNSDQQIFNRIRDSKSNKEQLKKTAQEFESIFIAKMFSVMDQSVDKEGGIFGEESKYFDNLKSFMFNEMGHEMATSKNSSFGLAKQVYEQMEKYVKD